MAVEEALREALRRPCIVGRGYSDVATACEDVMDVVASIDVAKVKVFSRGGTEYYVGTCLT